MKPIIAFLFFFTVHLFAQNYKIVTEHFPPYQIFKNNQLSGISVDIITEIQRRAKTNYPIELLDKDDAYEKTLKNKNYILFSVQKTIRNEKNFQLIGPLTKINYVFFKTFSNKNQIKNLQDAKKAEGILVSRNNLAHQVLLRLDFKNLIVVDLAECDNNIRTLANLDKNVLLATDYKRGMYEIKTLGLQNKLKPINIDKPVSERTLYIAFNKNADPKIIQKWQKLLNEIFLDGTYNKIINKYL